MFIAYRARYLLDAHICLRKQIGGTLHPVFHEQSPQAHTGMLFEKVLQVGLAQIAFQSQIMNLAWRTGFNHLQDLADAALLYLRSKHTQPDIVALGRSIARNGFLRSTIRRRGTGAALSSRRMKRTHEMPLHDPAMSPVPPGTKFGLHVSRYLPLETQCLPSHRPANVLSFKLPT